MYILYLEPSLATPGRIPSARILLDWCVKGCPSFAAAEGMPQELHCEQRFHSKDVEFPEPDGKDCPSLHGLPGRQNNGGVPVNSLGYKDLIEEIVLFSDCSTIFLWALALLLFSFRGGF